jgi:hypothetical protein
MWEKICNFLDDPSGIKREVDIVNNNLTQSRELVIREVKESFKEAKRELSKPFDDIVEEYQEKLDKANERAEFFCMSLTNLGDVMPDMLWFKYVDGTYAYTNKAIRDNLLFEVNPTGKDDISMSSEAVRRFGKDNHNFGVNCAGSDGIVIEHGSRRRFIEYGKAGGKPLVLEVYKNVVRNTRGEIIGTVGNGRDITEMIFTMFKLVERARDCGTSCTLGNKSNAILEAFLHKYLYEDTTSERNLHTFYAEHKGIYDEWY